MDLRNLPDIVYVYLSNVHHEKSYSEIKGCKNNLRGSYLVQVNVNPFVTTGDIIYTLEIHRDLTIY